MANPEHVETLKQGADIWNQWRDENPTIQPDFTFAGLSKTILKGRNLRGANLSKANLIGVTLNYSDLSDANLYAANLNKANLFSTNFTGANLSHTALMRADFSNANLHNANLYGASLSKTYFGEAVLKNANLCNAELHGTQFVNCDLSYAKLTGCSIFGVSVWDVDLTGAEQKNLIVAPSGKHKITVDNLEVAQFIYLLLNNQKIRDVIDTVGKKAVLILGRFTPERKEVLDAIREELRKRDYLPILFDFDKPTSRDLTETVSVLAHMSRFIIADVTDAKSIPQELQIIVPNLPSVPVQPLLLSSQNEYGMFEHFKRYPWVLKTYLYRDKDELLASLTAAVIEPAEAKANELVKGR